MAQTRKRRRRKHRGTQGGRIDTRRRAGRPRTRQEARARARSQRTPKVDQPPTWRSAFTRGLLASALAATFLSIISHHPLPSILLGLVMLGLYVPGGYYLETLLWRRRMRQKMRAQEKR